MQYATIDVEKNSNSIIFSNALFTITIPFENGNSKQSVFKKHTYNTIEPTFIRWVCSFFSNFDVFNAIPENCYVMQIAYSETKAKPWKLTTVSYQKPETGNVVLISKENAKAYALEIRSFKNKPRSVSMYEYYFCYGSLDDDSAIRTKIFDIKCANEIVVIDFLGHDQIVRGADFFIANGVQYFSLRYGSGAGSITVPVDNVHLLLASCFKKIDGKYVKVVF